MEPPITRPKPKRITPSHADPASPDHITPHEERRLRRALLRRIDKLFEVAEAKGYGPAPEKFIKPRNPDCLPGNTARICRTSIQNVTEPPEP